MAQQIRRGDIYYADLNPVIGSEQGDTRPVLVVQNNVGNKHSPTVVVVPLTSSKKAFLPTHVKVSRMGGLRAGSTALTEQVRTLDRSRFEGYIGRISDDTQAAIDYALTVSVGLAKQKPRKKSVLDLCLCPHCVSDFECSGYLIIKKGWQEVLESCDFCKVGKGWNFGVFDKKGE